MKKIFVSVCAATCILVGTTFATGDISLSLSSDLPQAISGSVPTFSLQVHNTTGAVCMIQEIQFFHPFLASLQSSLPAWQIGSSPTPSIWLPFLPAVSLFTLNQGQTGQLTLSGTLRPSSRGFNSLTFTGNIAYLCTSGGFTVAQGRLTTGVQITPIADLTLEQTLLTPVAHNSGDKVAYAIKVMNRGSQVANGIKLETTFPQTTLNFESSSVVYSAPLYTFIKSSLNPGEEWAIVITGSLKGNIPVNTLFNTLSSVSLSGSEYTLTNNSATLTGIVAAYFDVFLTTAFPASTAPQISGDLVSFLINYGNTSNTPILNSTITASISGTNISGLVYTLGTLPAALTGSVIVTGYMNKNYPTGTPLCLQARIDALGEQGNTGNNLLLMPACITVAPVADLSLSTSLVPGTDLSSLVSGSQVGYIITLTNTGTLGVTGAFVDITLPNTLLGYTNSFSTQTGNLSSFLWTGISLVAGQSISYVITGTVGTIPLTGLQLFLSGNIGFSGIESSLANNTSSTNTFLPGLADLSISADLLPFTGFTFGDAVVYKVKYKNEGGRTVTGFSILSSLASVVNATPTARSFPVLIPGQTGEILVTGNFNTFLSSGQTFVSSFTITGNAIDANISNNTTVITGVVAGRPALNLTLSAHNVTKPQMDTPPYGSGMDTMIQAVSGDIVALTITYGNNGNVVANNVSINLVAGAGFLSLSSFNGQLGTITIGQSGTLVVTGVVGPRNYISFTPSVTLSSSLPTLSDSVIIQEPFVCGDGFLTRNEVCDPVGQLGVIISGQECQKQQNSCVLVTKYIVNTACFDYQFGTQTGGQICSSVQLPLSDASCTSMTAGAPVSTSNGYSVSLSCLGNNTLAGTPITIDCGNGNVLSGVGASLQTTCQYTGNFVGNAQCRVGNDLNNLACKSPISITAGQCKSLEAEDGGVVILEEDDGDFVGESRFTCTTNNGITAQTMRIDCNGTLNNDGSKTANNVSSLSTTCRYTEDEDNLPKERTVRCYVDETTTTDCTKKLILDQGTFGRCGDHIRQGREKCDDGEDNGTSRSQCTKGCDIIGAVAPACFSVNQGNLSVQEGEIVPFRWKIDQTKLVSSCNSSSSKGKVLKDSLKCVFKLFNGENRESGKGITFGDYDAPTAETMPINCNTDLWTADGNLNSNPRPLFQYIYDLRSNIWSLQNPFGRYRFRLTKDIVDGVYGEYNLALSQVQYKYCGENGETLVGDPIDRVCETDFAVTKPYLVQKSSFGLTPKTTDNIDLDGYLDINGDELIRKTDLDKIMVLNAKTYDGGSSVKSMMSKFISKYEKLALDTKKKTEEGVPVYKVPGQNILIFSGSQGGKITIRQTDTYGKFTTPFTIIVKGANLVVKGSFTQTNLMFLVKGGTITFDPSDTNACSKQTVQGIFITDKTFGSSERLLNDNVNKARCTEGSLYVKGVLIGDGLANLVKTKRSQLNHWFMVGGSSEAAIQAERRNEIFNGASVLIEYSPSLWSALPPGASEFTKALDVYKQ